MTQAMLMGMGAITNAASRSKWGHIMVGVAASPVALKIGVGVAALTVAVAIDRLGRKRYF